MTRNDLLDEISGSIIRVDCPHPLRVAIDGVDAAGKTVLADELAAKLEKLGRPVIRASIDGFHNPKVVRYRRGSASPEGYYSDSFNYEEVKAVLLVPLGPGGNRVYRTAAFDFRTDSAVDSADRTAPSDSILLFDGVFLLRRELLRSWDFTIFVDVDFKVSVERAVVRDAESLGGVDAARKRYLERYVPGQKIYLSECNPGALADLVVENNDPLNPEIKMRREP